MAFNRIATQSRIARRFYVYYFAVSREILGLRRLQLLGQRDRSSRARLHVLHSDTDVVHRCRRQLQLITVYLDVVDGMRTAVGG